MNNVKTFLKRHYPFFVLFVAVFVCVTLVSQCSFLYRWNEWVDVHCYYTVASFMKQGGVLYRDIFEQKGPYLYFIHLISICIVPSGYGGMYIFELVYGWIFAFATYFTIRLFKRNRAIGLTGSLLSLLCLYLPLSFCYGDSVEEMMAPLFALSLYWLLKSATRKKEMKWWQLCLSGLFCGLALFSKFSLVAFYGGFAIVVFVSCCVDHKVHRGFLAALYFLIGLAVSSIPALIYFGVNHAFGDFYQVYFYNNIFHYSSAKSSGLGEKLLGYLIAYGARFIYGYTYMPLILFGLIEAIVAKKIHKNRQFFAILAPYASLNLLIVIGGVSYPYYGLPNAAFAFVGFLGIIDLLSKKESVKQYLKSHVKAGVAVSCVAFGVLSFVATPNMPKMFLKEDDIPVYQMRDIIKKEEEPTLLNYGTLDAGLYYLCDIQPTTKYFTGLNGDFAELKAEQQRIIDEGLVTFVYFMDDNMPENIDLHYQKVYEAPYKELWMSKMHYLYQLKK